MLINDGRVLEKKKTYFTVSITKIPITPSISNCFRNMYSNSHVTIKLHRILSARKVKVRDRGRFGLGGRQARPHPSKGGRAAGLDGFMLKNAARNYVGM